MVPRSRGRIDFGVFHCYLSPPSGDAFTDDVQQNSPTMRVPLGCGKITAGA